MICKICNYPSRIIFEAQILQKYDVSYYFCEHCGFLQTEEPFWLEEAYSDSIALSDTGILSRNLFLSKIASILIYFGFDKQAKFVDFAGGYGVFTRLMRDIGFDFFWNDPYTKNIVAKGFDFEPREDVEMLTAFEAFEHFSDPLKEIDKMLDISSNVFFSTVLLPSPVPRPGEWSYYVLEHGQHISFYSLRSLEIIAEKLGLNFLSNGVNMHLFTKKKISPIFYTILLKSHRLGLASYVRRRMRSRTISDMEHLLQKMETK